MDDPDDGYDVEIRLQANSGTFFQDLNDEANFLLKAPFALRLPHFRALEPMGTRDAQRTADTACTICQFGGTIS